MCASNTDTKRHIEHLGVRIFPVVFQTKDENLAFGARYHNGQALHQVLQEGRQKVLGCYISYSQSYSLLEHGVSDVIESQTKVSSGLIFSVAD